MNERIATPGRRRHLVLLGVSWLALLLFLQWYARSYGLSIPATLEQLALLIASAWYGPLLFLLAAALSPLVLVPAALLGLVGGAVFGPVLGLVYTLAGCNLSASLCYAVGSSLGQHARERLLAQSGILARYCQWLHRNSFLAVIVMRLGFLPYDLVSYTVGALHIGWLRFIVANTLGCLPGAVVLVVLGASFQRFQMPTGIVQPWMIVVAVLLAAASLLVAVGLRRKEPDP